MSDEEHKNWVEFMHDVSVSHGCIFSFWSLTEPKSGKKWSNENIESDFD